MLVIQVVPREGVDAWRLLRHKVIHEARTWSFKNRAKTRLEHVQQRGGHIEVGRVNGVVMARIQPREEGEEFFLAEKFIGRLIAWFADDLSAINLQFLGSPAKKKRRRRG